MTHQPNQRVRTLILTVLLLGTAMAGCAAPTGDEGRAEVYVKDAATDEFRHVNITFSKVAIHQGDGEADNASKETEPETDGAGWTTVFEGSETINLLAFSEADSQALLGTANLSAGTYDQVVVTVDDAQGVTTDGETVDIRVITGWVRVVRAFTIEAGQTTSLVVDLDMDRSLVEQGPQGWALKPVVGQLVVQDGSLGERADPSTEPGDGDPPDDGTEINDTTEGTERVQTPLTAYIKDAPTDEFGEVWLTVDEVRVHWAGNDSGDDVVDITTNASGGNGTAEENGTEDGNGTSEEEGRWITVFDGTRSIDLLRFNSSDARAFLGAAEVPTGKYTQITLNVTAAWGIKNGSGENVTITVASGTARINQPFEATANATVQVVIDLDLDQSLVRQGGGQGGQGAGQVNQSGGSDGERWRLTPVIGSVAVNHVDQDPRADVPDDA